ncbi:MAG: GNAT family N-acetyltransferase, partial [Burkholderiaceae bacterium]
HVIRTDAHGAPRSILLGTAAGAVVVWPLMTALDAHVPTLLPLLLPGGLSASAALQTAYYSHHVGFGLAFEAQRLRDIASFMDRYDPLQDGVWLLVHAGRIHGTMVIDHDSGHGTPEMRWFILSDALRGQGWGRRMMEVAMDFCRARHARVVLHSRPELVAACRLYEDFGFVRLGQAAPGEHGVSKSVEVGYEWTR